MREWLRANVKEGAVVAAHPTERYLLLDKPGIEEEKGLRVVPLVAWSSYSAEEVKEDGADFVLLGLDVVGESTMWWALDRRMSFGDQWNRPVEVAKNGYVQLAAREYLMDGIFAAVKPWQAMDNNYVFAKVPKVVIENEKLVRRYGFDDMEVGFIQIDGARGKQGGLVYDEEVGRTRNGSLKIGQDKNSFFPVVRWVSPVFEVKSGRSYRVEGWVRSGGVVEKENRDGFLRVDFYRKLPVEWREETTGVRSGVSARYFGGGEWKQVVALGVAPEGAAYATWSFQVGGEGERTFWVDDVQVWEGEVDGLKKDDGLGLVIEENVMVSYLGGGF